MKSTGQCEGLKILVKIREDEVMLEGLCEKSKGAAREPWHRYRLPGYDSEDGFPSYRFEWELFGEAVFYTSMDMSIQPVTLSYFSRAILR